ncbi:MAG: DUF4303 domain-containing protein [Myxococcota bacterium]
MTHEADWVAHLEKALKATAREFVASVPDEAIYAFALYTSGESDFGYALASANTEEGLARTAARYLERGAGDPEAVARDLRWNPGDWAFHELPGPVENVTLPGEVSSRDEVVYAGFVAAMKALKRSRILPPETMYAVVCGDMSLGFLRRGLEALNSKARLRSWLRQYTPDRWLAEIRALDAEARVTELVATLEDLYLERDTPRAKRARSFNVSRFVVGDEVEAQGPAAVDPLIDLVARHGMGDPFNPRGSAAFERHGAFSPATRLSTASARSLSKCGPLTERQISEVRRLIQRRFEIDRTMPTAGTLAANLARSLHALRPERFPPSKMSPATNHLLDPERYFPDDAP